MTADRSILLADDIPDHVRMYEAALKKQGYRVRLVRTGAEALAAVKVEVPDGIVVDVRLPDMTGLELCQRLKRQADTEDTPVVLLTSDVSESAAVQAAEVGCSAWLAHPTVAADLVGVVNQVLSLRRGAPADHRGALIAAKRCTACGSDRIQAMLRLATMQYYGCRSCGLTWRVERAGSVA